MIIKIQVITDEPEADVVFKSFKGDELTSPEQQAILFLKDIDKEEVDF